MLHGGRNEQLLERYETSSSSSRMRVIYHNWSAMKQRPHPQSVAEIYKLRYTDDGMNNY